MTAVAEGTDMLRGQAGPVSEPDAWQAAVQDLKDIGELHAAYAAGREDEGAERDARWNKIARPVARGGPAHAELQRRRWTLRGEPRTRETFGQPHPGDYMGRDGAA